MARVGDAKTQQSFCCSIPCLAAETQQKQRADKGYGMNMQATPVMAPSAPRKLEDVGLQIVM
ncbi:MAG: hypothetical protein ACU0DI_12195, partial [Paracoccaceae bacterium]